MTNIVAIPAFQDNYIWALSSLEGSELIVVDPGTADPVFAYLQKNNLRLSTILITHHHWDHSGGIEALRAQFPDVQVIGPAHDNVKGLTKPVKENDVLRLANTNITLRVLDIPGHTLGHIAFYNEEILFCGDTLFSSGCGRVFEGTPAQMYESLNKLKKLSKNTLIYCGHEYTLANIAFAQCVEPNNKALAKRKEDVEYLRAKQSPSLPSTIEQELMCNPFLRCEEIDVIQAVQNHAGINTTDPVSIFSHLREWKNNFKA